MSEVAIRVGIDLVSVESVRAALSAHGERYLARVYTPDEVTECSTDGVPDAQRLAARFAAKEAMLKVLRVRDEGIAWPSIELVRTEWGGVDVALSGTAAERAAARGLSSFAVSLTHEDGYAAAVVVAAESVAPE